MAAQIKHLGVGVIESRWFNSLNTSVRPLFDQLSEIWTGRISAHHYEMFNDANALKEIMLRVSNRRGIRMIYLAGHGRRNGLVGSNGATISRRHLRNIIRQVAAEGCRKTKGLYIGSCLFTDTNTAHFILKSAQEREHPIIWMAGYSTSVDWIDTISVDNYFMNCWIKQSVTSGGESARIRRVAAQMAEFMPGASRQLGFNIFVRRPGNNGVEALLPLKGD